jgi:hypothetical protein
MRSLQPQSQDSDGKERRFSFAHSRRRKGDARRYLRPSERGDDDRDGCLQGGAVSKVLAKRSG